MLGDDGQAGKVVHVLGQVGHPDDERAGGVGSEGLDVALLGGSAAGLTPKTAGRWIFGVQIESLEAGTKVLGWRVIKLLTPTAMP